MTDRGVDVRVPVVSAAEIAVIGRQKLYVYLVSNTAMLLSANAMLPRANSCACCHGSSPLPATITRVMPLKFPAAARPEEGDVALVMRPVTGQLRAAQTNSFDLVVISRIRLSREIEDLRRNQRETASRC